MNYYLKKLTEIATKTKYTKWYINIINTALNRNIPPEPVEKHHILPKCFKLGGALDILNIVVLTHREHFIVHHLLVKMFIGPFQNKMRYAYWAMGAMFNKNRRNTSHHYAAAKRELIKARRAFRHTPESKKRMSLARTGLHVGELNHMYGKRGPLHHGFGKPGPFAGRNHSIETKQQMSENNIMNRDPYAGSRIRWTPEERQNHSIAMAGSGNNNAKKWKATNVVSKEEWIIEDLKAFCLLRSWKYYSLMTRRSTGKPYKGFVFKEI